MKKAVLFVLFATFFLRTISAIDLPAPPPGFTWQEIPELKAAFLRPNGWFFKHEVAKGTLAYFITKEDIDQNGKFRTGLTVNVFRKLKKESAVDLGKNLVDKLAADNHGEKWADKEGPFQKFGCLMTNAHGTTVNTIAVANPKTNTFYIFVFESPKSDWDTAWKTGKQVMDTLAIDDEI